MNGVSRFVIKDLAAFSQYTYESSWTGTYGETIYVDF